MRRRGLRRLLDWRAALVYTHRWLGIAGCVLFAAWFVSGVVMMYARMPALAAEERLARAADLDLSTVTLSPSEAAARAGVSADDVQIAMLRGRPVYRFAAAGRGRRGAGASGSGTLFADTGEAWHDTGIDDARAAARVFEPAYTGPFHDDGVLTEPDQWTLQARPLLPMYRFALDDGAATRLYVSAATGEVVLRTTRKERFWGYLGPVIHWIYFTPLRRNGPLWTEVIIWSSLAGCLMCATGLVWGAVRFSPFARFRLKRVASRTPYVGWMKWHHYAGLVFGLVTLTWVYSGLLSMGPFNWFRPTGGRSQAREARPRPPAAVTIEQLRAAHAAFSSTAASTSTSASETAFAFAPKVLRMVRIDGQHFWVAERAPSAAEADRWRSPSLLPRTFRPRLARAYVSVAHPERGAIDRFPVETLHAAARDAMGDTPVAETAWLDAYDGYYYDARGAEPLPVLRIRYADPQQTWLYLDPGTGGIVQRSERVTRLRRWLYQGLHSLDFPFLYYHRPLWDIVVVLLSIGGVALSVTTMAPAWRRLAAHARRWLSLSRSSPRREPAPLMESYRQLMTVVLVAGTAAGLLLSAIQHVIVDPLIYRAERQEHAADTGHPGVRHADAGHAHARRAHDGQVSAAAAAPAEWQPRDGVERTMYTVLGTTLTGIGFAALLFGIASVLGLELNLARGVLLGLFGFACCVLAPAMGLPPGPPGAAAADLQAAQVWWVSTAVATAVGLWAMVRADGSWAWRITGMVMIALPHLIGAPVTMGTSPVPSDLSRQFAIASVATRAVFWITLGGIGGPLYERLSRVSSMEHAR